MSIRLAAATLALTVSLIVGTASSQGYPTLSEPAVATGSLPRTSTHNRKSGWGDCSVTPRNSGKHPCRDPFLRRRHRAHGDHDIHEQPVRVIKQN